MQFDNKCNETFLCYENHMYLKERRFQLKSDINKYFEKHSILWHLMERVPPSNMTIAQ